MLHEHFFRSSVWINLPDNPMLPTRINRVDQSAGQDNTCCRRELIELLDVTKDDLDEKELKDYMIV
jgi:hypothetical protein